MIYRVKERISAIEAEELAKDLKGILDSGQDVIVDFSQNQYIASAGFRALLIALKTARVKGYDFSVVNVNDKVKEIFDVAGLTSVFLLSDKDKSELKR